MNYLQYESDLFRQKIVLFTIKNLLNITLKRLLVLLTKYCFKRIHFKVFY